MVKDHSDSDLGNPLSPHGLLFPISSKGFFICIIPQTGALAGTTDRLKIKVLRSRYFKRLAYSTRREKYIARYIRTDRKSGITVNK